MNEEKRTSEVKIQTKNQLQILNWAFNISLDMLEKNQDSIFQLGQKNDSLNTHEYEVFKEFKDLYRNMKTNQKLYKNIKKVFSVVADNFDKTLEEDFPILLKFNDNNLGTIMCVCNVIGRAMMGQITELAEFKNDNFGMYDGELLKLKYILFPELTPTGFYLLYAEEVSNNARVLMDIYQCIRFYLSWRDAENTPETREWPSQMTTNYDYPTHFSEEPLIEVVEIGKDGTRSKNINNVKYQDNCLRKELVICK